MKQTVLTFFIATIGGVGLLISEPAAAWFNAGNVTGEPTKYQRHVACNEAWRKSHAHKVQGCKLRSVHWDSYHGNTYFGYSSHMFASTCWVDVKCDFGHRPGVNIFPEGVHRGKIKWSDVHKLRQCKHDASLVNTSCEPLTEEHVDQAVARHNEQMAGWMAAFAKWLEENGY